MEFIVPFVSDGHLLKKTLSKVKHLIKKKTPTDRFFNQAFVWMPHTTVHFVTPSSNEESTVVNNFFAADLEEVEDLIYLFRPSFLKQKRKKGPLKDVLSQVQGIKTRQLPARTKNIKQTLNSFLEFANFKLKDLPKMKKKKRDVRRREIQGRNVFPPNLRADLHAEERYTSLRQMEILLKMAFGVSHLPSTIQVDETTLLYSPYVLTVCQTKGEKRCFFHNIGKKKGFFSFLTKKIRSDEGLQEFCRKEPEAKNLLLRQLSE